MMQSSSRTPSRPGWHFKRRRRRHRRQLNRRLPRSMSRRQNCHQRSPSNQREDEGAHERPKPRPKNLRRLQSCRSWPPPIIRHLQTISSSIQFLRKFRKASLRSASRAAIATRCTSSSSHRSLVYSADEALPTPITLDSLNPARSDARSATNSRFRSVGPITETITASATRPPGGTGRLSIRWRLHESYVQQLAPLTDI